MRYSLINTEKNRTIQKFATLEDAEVSLTLLQLYDCQRHNFSPNRYDVLKIEEKTDAEKTHEAIGDKIAELIFCGLALFACPTICVSTIWLAFNINC